MSLTTAFCQTKTEKVKVYGNCGMCASRIENAAKSVDGVTAADWCKETKMIEVSFDSAKTDVHKVHMVLSRLVMIPKCTRQKKHYHINCVNKKYLRLQPKVFFIYTVSEKVSQKMKFTISYQLIVNMIE